MEAIVTFSILSLSIRTLSQLCLQRGWSVLDSYLFLPIKHQLNVAFMVWTWIIISGLWQATGKGYVMANTFTFTALLTNMSMSVTCQVLSICPTLWMCTVFIYGLMKVRREDFWLFVPMKVVTQPQSFLEKQHAIQRRNPSSTLHWQCSLSTVKW